MLRKAQAAAKKPRFGSAAPLLLRGKIALGCSREGLLVHPLRRTAECATVGVADDDAAKAFIGSVERADVLIALIEALFSGDPGADIDGEPLLGTVLIH